MSDSAGTLLVVIMVLITALVLIKRVRLIMIDVPQADWLTKYHYAHRGLHDGDIPENSIKAFEKAIDAGYAIELDVRLTKDGKIVVFHDKDLMRMTGLHGRIKNYTLQELKRLSLGDSGEKIPELREVLELVDGRVPILFEIKNNGFAGKLERTFYENVKEYKGKFAVQAFSPFSLRWFKLNAPDILRGQLACDIRFCSEGMSSFKRNLLNLLLLELKWLETNFICKPNFISYEYHKISSNIIKKLRKRGAVVFAWTIRDEEQLHLAAPYTDAVIFEKVRPFV